MDIKVTVTIGLDEAARTAINTLAAALAARVAPTAQVEAKTAVAQPKAAPAAPAAAPAAAAPAPEPAQTKEKSKYTIDEVRQAFANAKRAGKPTAEIKAILTNFGAAVVSELKEEHYAEVIDAIAKLYL